MALFSVTAYCTLRDCPSVALQRTTYPDTAYSLILTDDHWTEIVKGLSLLATTFKLLCNGTKMFKKLLYFIC